MSLVLMHHLSFKRLCLSTTNLSISVKSCRHWRYGICTDSSVSHVRPAACDSRITGDRELLFVNLRSAYCHRGHCISKAVAVRHLANHANLTLASSCNHILFMRYQ
jgi:hypothetical protein